MNTVTEDQEDDMPSLSVADGTITKSCKKKIKKIKTSEKNKKKAESIRRKHEVINMSWNKMTDSRMSVIAVKKLREFTFSPKLAPELRLKIWAHAIADIEPRVMEVTFDRTGGKCVSRSAAITPPFFYLFREALDQAKKTYKGLYVFQNFTGAIIDYEKDVLLLSTRAKEDYFTIRDVKEERWMDLCRNLAVEHKFFHLAIQLDDDPSPWLAQFRKVRSLLAVEHYSWKDRSPGDQVTLTRGAWHSEQTAVALALRDAIKANTNMDYGCVMKLVVAENGSALKVSS